MIRRFTRGSGWVAALTAAVLGCASSAQAGPRQQVTWYLSTWGSSRAVNKAVEVLAETVARETGDGFKIIVQYGEALSPARDNLDSISVGVIEAGHFCPSYHPGKTPLMLALELPFLPIPNLDASRRLALAYYRHPEVVREMDKFNAVALMQTTAPRYEFMGTGEPPLTLERWQGLRVRAPGNVGDAVRAMGGQPTSVAAPEIYTGLERGMFDAATLPFPYAFASYRIQEVATWYTYNLNAGMPNCVIAANQGAINALPEVYRQALFDAIPSSIDAQINLLEEEDAKWVAQFDAAGLKRVTYTDRQIADLKSRYARQIWDDWVGKVTRRGLPGREMLDFILDEAARVSQGVSQ
ncbi:MAG: C4-dicarboxylate ABC transporter substrate-binding protein [Rhodospirillaceae bacterium]|nr:C4-dicarboxylate ABC transporter substrate-binding protein [Rhodospirillaceae bacterium]